MQPELHVDPSIYNKSFPRFDRPRIIGFIDLENLKFARHLSEKNVKFDLNLCFDKAKRKPDDLDVKLNELLKFLLQEELALKLPLENKLDDARFFCYRGLMTSIACTPYEKRESWKIVVMLYKGNIYLCARDTEDKINRKKNMTEQDYRFTSWGYKFEQYMLSDTPDSDPNPEEPVDETEEFSLVFTTHLNKHVIVYGAEMDGIRCDRGSVPQPPRELGTKAIIQYLSSQDFIELKTNRHIEFPRQETSFRRFKTKKWWCQSFLTGIDTIVCGFRNDDGIVEEIKTFPLKSLVKMSERFWNPNVCFNFLDSFFTYVKRCLARHLKHKYGIKAVENLQTLPLITLHFEYKPGMPIQVTNNYSYEDDPILPQWFIENYGRHKS